MVHFYVETEDLQAVLDKAESLGAKTVMPVTDVGGAVTIAMFNDPDGLLIGLVKAVRASRPLPFAQGGGHLPPPRLSAHGPAVVPGTCFGYSPMSLASFNPRWRASRSHPLRKSTPAIRSAFCSR